MSWDLIGNGWASELLARHIAHGALRHAYLITGPAGVGRRTLALRLAQALACTAPSSPGHPCRQCATCQRIERMQHPDLSTVQAEQEIEVPKSEHPDGVKKIPHIGGVLKVEQIRELQHRLALAPYEAPYRIALLLRFEEAHLSAANALLKTLEEPNPQVILVLTAESAESLPATIVSRCEILRLHPAAIDELAAGLISRGVEPDLAQLYAHISAGLPGYALRLAQTKELRDQRSEWIEELYRLCGANRTERFEYARYLLPPDLRLKVEELKLKLALWGTFWRDVLLRASGANATITNMDWDVEINALASQMEAQVAYQVLDGIDRTLSHLRANVNPRLAFEVLLLDLPRLRIKS